MALRDEFPVLERIAYLNAGTDGPIPRAAAEAARAEIASEAEEGRLWPHFERRMALTDQLRAGYARLLGCEPDDIAVTSGTSAGLGAVLAGMDIGPGDEIVTSEHEHPGLLGPLIAARPSDAVTSPQGEAGRAGPAGTRRTFRTRPLASARGGRAAWMNIA